MWCFRLSDTAGVVRRGAGQPEIGTQDSGMRVCDEIIHLYEGKDRDAAEALAVTVSTAIAKEIFPYTDGYYLMTPFRRVALMEHIIQNIQQSCIS